MEEENREPFREGKPIESRSSCRMMSVLILQLPLKYEDPSCCWARYDAQEVRGEARFSLPHSTQNSIPSIEARKHQIDLKSCRCCSCSTPSSRTRNEVVITSPHQDGKMLGATTFVHGCTHTCNESKAWLHNNGIDLIEFPPHSLDLKNLWAYLKRRIDNRCPSNKAESMEILNEEWAAIDGEFLASLAHSMIDRCKAVVACRGFKTKYWHRKFTTSNFRSRRNIEKHLLLSMVVAAQLLCTVSISIITSASPLWIWNSNLTDLLVLHEDRGSRGWWLWQALSKKDSYDDRDRSSDPLGLFAPRSDFPPIFFVCKIFLPHYYCPCIWFIWLISSFVRSLIHWLIHWFIDWLFIDWSSRWLIDWLLFDSWMKWFCVESSTVENRDQNWQFTRLFDSLIGWLIIGFIHWLIDRSIVWLVVQFCVERNFLLIHFIVERNWLIDWLNRLIWFHAFIDSIDLISCIYWLIESTDWLIDWFERDDSLIVVRFSSSSQSTQLNQRHVHLCHFTRSSFDSLIRSNQPIYQSNHCCDDFPPNARQSTALRFTFVHPFID